MLLSNLTMTMGTKTLHNKLNRFFDQLVSDKLTESIIKTGMEFPDRPAISDFLIGKILNFQNRLKDQDLNRFNNQEENVDCPELAYMENGICNALIILTEFNDLKAVPTVVELLETCLECKYRIVFSYCIDALITLGQGSLDLLIDKYYSYESSPDKQGVWVEILAKLNKKDERIREVLENHIKINSCEAILAIGDYKDKYFVPILKEIVEKAALRLRNKNLNPFQKMVRAWNSDADIYIETRSILIELEYDVNAGSLDYEKLVTELDASMLPHIDSKESYIQRNMLAKQEIKPQHNNENIFNI